MLHLNKYKSKISPEFKTVLNENFYSGHKFPQEDGGTFLLLGYLWSSPLLIDFGPSVSRQWNKQLKLLKNYLSPAYPDVCD